MADELIRKWGNFSLSEEESVGVEAIDSVVEVLESRSQSWLVGKLIADKIIGKDYIHSTLIKGWKPTGSLHFKVLGENLFLLDFQHSWNRSRVLEGQPWIFEGQLFLVEELDGLTPPSRMKFDSAAFWIRMYDLPMVCTEREMGFKLEATVGKVEDVDTDVDGTGWGKYLRVRVHVNLAKPIPRGRTLKLKDKSYWVPFQYKKVRKFCFSCGVISHGPQGCLKGDGKGKQGDRSDLE
ncbi:uncharacterized protein LOC132188022 [Corylus avellana]|uniref:uncharacterized protein LOC132188022 n=1 Tax=Corylus avellana TaxID=13451 RepID=UPI00286B6249|nr:uncharacterized protein LOC132188022 [Corylus avellana]